MNDGTSAGFVAGVDQRGSVASLDTDGMSAAQPQDADAAFDLTPLPFQNRGGDQPCGGETGWKAPARNSPEASRGHEEE